MMVKKGTVSMSVILSKGVCLMILKDDTIGSGGH